MASLIMHLAVAKRYLEENKGKVKDERAFYDGNILPDFDPDKENSHYGKRTEANDLIKRHREKVGLDKFLQSNKLDTDKNLGRFLHLYTDWVYYNELLSHDYLRTVDMAQFPKDNIYTVFVYDKYVQEKYGVHYGLTSMEKEINEAFEKWNAYDEKRWGKNFTGEILFTREQLDDFIEQVVQKFRCTFKNKGV